MRKATFVTALFLFLCGYSPLFLIFAIRELLNRGLGDCFTIAFLALTIIPVVYTFWAISLLKTGAPTHIQKIRMESGNVIEHTIPYFFGALRIDLSDPATLFGMVIIFAILFAIHYKTGALYINPILMIFGGYFFYKAELPDPDGDVILIVKGKFDKKTPLIDRVCWLGDRIGIIIPQEENDE